MQFGHGLVFLLPALAPILGPTGIGCGQAHAGVEPAGQGGMLLETLGLPCKFNKDGLSQILSQVRVGVRFAERGGIDHVHMPLNQLFESWLGARLSVFAKEFVIGCHACVDVSSLS